MAVSEQDRPAVAGRPESRRGLFRRILLPLCKFGLALLILAGLYRLDILQLHLPEGTVLHPWPFLLGALLVLATVPLLAERWRLLLSVQGLALPFGTIFGLTGLALFCNLTLPGGSGGDALRCLAVVRRLDERRTRALVSIFMDKWLGLLGLSMIGAGAMLLRWREIAGHPALALAGTVIAAVSGGAFVLTLLAIWLAGHRGRLYRALTAPKRPVWLAVLGQLVDAVGSYRYHAGRLAVGVLISLLGHGLTIVGLLVVSRGFGNLGLDADGYAAAMAIGLLANLIPLTPGGLGFGEIAFAQVAGALSTGGPVVAYATIFLIFRVVTVLGLAPGALVWFLRRERGRPAAEAGAPPS
ncbi:Uncharacterized membrane protein YbhN, UPF0104 family [Tistlia consotensis]|uniref:Uncharacterized membrane protein YbhN, UPF0104 family n=1 Tax=Tistlia consotensis USBA 355 TaxID=560819 RepID=A0A1Y6BDV3_9PROT|nr:lysylphosphatidylglycerol synthase transmembrane domain-containing protein [Tistlia consotensis]SME98820.1 Uncharacterized membrane protein YbhN, UPF0104 family [Tistlia consotensis USBA 355]SNR58242.1 Uncharacterized membrane protein YbhN, UPF0104 family [Tistlia consotensis]